MLNKESRLGLGLAAVGRPLYINLRKKDPRVSFSLAQFKAQGLLFLKQAYELGIRHFDTAPGYGMAEALLVEFLGGKHNNGITVSTKWGYTYIAHFDKNAKVHEVKEHSLAKLKEQWDFSKKMLPSLTCYQIHSATLDTGVLTNSKVLGKLHELKQEFDLKIGLTTTGVNQVEVLKKALDVRIDKTPLFECVQCTFNLLDQSIILAEHLLKERNISIIVKEALANGRILPNKKYPHYQKMYDCLQKLANKYDVDSDAIALRFAMNAFEGALVLSGANTLEHLTSNLRAESFQLSEDEMEELKAFWVPPERYWEERKRLTWN